MRKFAWAIALAMAASGATAQTEVVTRSEAQRLACLVKSAPAPHYPKPGEALTARGTMRLKLKFNKPDAEPTVEVLFNSAREDMQEQVYTYVAGYRLPCLQHDDGEVMAVQDFTFQNGDQDPWPAMATRNERRPLPCIVMPRKALVYEGDPRPGRPRTEHLVAYITFRGDGNQPPEVEFVYSKASSHLERAVRDKISEYRMPCYTGAKPFVIQQTFSYFPDGKRRFGFQRDRFSLMDFLGMTREPQKLRARFDLNSMSCPFSVTYYVGASTFPNRTEERGPVDLNRTGFLNWLASLQIAFSSDEMANDLFGSDIQIDVPCGVLDLQSASAGDR